jgi:hypothetical protein
MVLLEFLVELEDVDEIIASVGRQANEQAEVDECEDNVTELASRSNAPMLEDDGRHHTVALEREVTACLGELATGDVPPLGEAQLRELERCEHEQVCALVKARVARPNAFHDALSKCQLRHVATPRMYELSVLSEFWAKMMGCPDSHKEGTYSRYSRSFGQFGSQA